MRARRGTSTRRIARAASVIGTTSTARWFRPLMVGGGFATAMTAPFELIYATTFDIGPMGMFLFILSTFVGMIVIDVFGTRLVPHLEARIILVSGILVFGLGCAVLGLAPDLTVLIAGRIIQGFGAGLFMGAGLQAAVRVNPDEQVALGAFNSSFLFGSAFGAPVGGLIAATIPGGYRVTFVACFVACAAVAAALWSSLPRLPAPEGRRPHIGLPQLTGPPGLRVAIVLAMTGDFIRGGVVYTALPLAGAERDLSPTTIGIAIGVLSAAEILVLTRTAPILRRVGLMRCLVGALALGIVCSAALALTTGWLAFMLGSLLFGLVVAGTTVGPALAIVALAGDAASGLAMYRIASGLGMLVGATLVGVLASTSGTAIAFVLIGAVLVTGIALALVVSRRLGGEPAGPPPSSAASTTVH